VSFEKSYVGEIKPVEITALKSLSEFDDPSIKYFAGNATYKIEFKIAQGLAASDHLLLDPGKFDATAEISLNGKKLGVLWNPGTRIDITGLLKDANLLEITVATVYRNRFIGDFVQYGKVQNLWTSSPIEQFLDKNKPLKPAGLIGPLKIIKPNGVLFD
jgi:hypothetical protein